MDKQVLIQSWFKWEMPGEPADVFFIVEDRLFTVCKAGGKYVLSQFLISIKYKKQKLSQLLMGLVSW